MLDYLGLPTWADNIIIIILIIITVILIVRGFIEEIKFSIPPSIKFRDRSKTKEKKTTETKKDNVLEEPKEYLPGAIFEHENIKWKVKKGTWHQYTSNNVLVGSDGDVALIENDELGKENFLLEIIFSVYGNLVDQINVQINKSELAFRGNGYGIVVPESGKCTATFEEGGIEKGQTQTLAIIKSGETIHAYLDGNFLKGKLLPVSDYKKGFLGIRTWNGTLTLHKIKYEKRDICEGFISIDKEDNKEQEPEMTIERVNKLTKGLGLKEISVDYIFGRDVESDPTGVMMMIQLEMKNMFFNLLNLFKEDYSDCIGKEYFRRSVAININIPQYMLNEEIFSDRQHEVALQIVSHMYRGDRMEHEYLSDISNIKSLLKKFIKEYIAIAINSPKAKDELAKQTKSP